jgi:hypothetical protein
MSIQTVREKTELEEEILEEVKRSKRKLTVEDYAEIFDWQDGFYMAIQFLVWQSMDLKIDKTSGVVSVR